MDRKFKVCSWSRCTTALTEGGVLHERSHERLYHTIVRETVVYLRIKDAPAKSPSTVDLRPLYLNVCVIKYIEQPSYRCISESIAVALEIEETIKSSAV